jgi:hypothetical protein
VKKSAKLRCHSPPGPAALQALPPLYLSLTVAQRALASISRAYVSLPFSPAPAGCKEEILPQSQDRARRKIAEWSRMLVLERVTVCARSCQRETIPRPPYCYHALAARRGNIFRRYIARVRWLGRRSAPRRFREGFVPDAPACESASIMVRLGGCLPAVNQPTPLVRPLRETCTVPLPP